MVGETVAERYELEELVGAGGMSSVYKAHDTLLERNVALKILHEHFTGDDEFVERFRREARSVAQLSHPNIVTVIDRGQDGEGRQFIVFEYIEGENLKELVVRKGRLPVRQALELSLEIAHGLSFAHEHGLVHRDVKPQNVLLNGDGRAKVTDFGIARSLDVEGVTQTGTVLGTSNYIAPEQASGQPVDARTDVYSLGVVLYELLAGDVPFPGESFVAVAMKHVNEPPPSLLDVRRDVPLRVAGAVDRALEKSPGQRFGSMAEFAAELEACRREVDGAQEEAWTTIVPPARDGGRRRRRRISPWAVGLALLGLLALGAVIVGLVGLRGRGHEQRGASTPAAPIRLEGVGSYDPPPGDGAEHNASVGKATDGDPLTYWDTEHYDSFSKQGVGLVLAARRPVEPTQVTVSSTTPGFTAEIKAGDTSVGPFPRVVSASQQVGSTTRFSLHMTRPARYFVLWITALPDNYARVTELHAG